MTQKRWLNIVYGPCFSAVVLLFAILPAPAQLAEKDLYELIGTSRWSDAEIEALQNSEPVARSIRTDDKQEIATFGILRIRGLPSISMSTFRDSLKQKGSGPRKRGGRFSEPPSLTDLQTLELDSDSIMRLSRCSIGKCDLNLSAEMIGRLRSHVDWKSPDAVDKATELIKEMLLDYARDYTSEGISSLSSYDNRRKMIDLTESHRLLLSKSFLIEQVAPEFVEYLEEYPNGDLANVENSMHWSVVDLGLKPSITISHASAYTETKSGTPQFIVASRQIYSSRYLDGSLTFTVLLRVWNGDEVDSYIIFLDRSRSDALGGAIARIARGVVEKEAKERVTNLLEKARSRLLNASQPVEAPSTATDDEISWTEQSRAFARKHTWVITGGILLAFLLILFLRQPTVRR